MSLKDNLARMTQLSSELSRSTRLQEYLPEAFKHGHCFVRARANMQYRPEDAVITFRLGDGTIIERKATDVPVEIWPPSLRVELQRLMSAPIWRRRYGSLFK